LTAAIDRANTYVVEWDSLSTEKFSVTEEMRAFRGHVLQDTFDNNWTTFAEDLVLDGCEKVLHLPLAGSFGVMSYRVGIIFRPRPGSSASFISLKV